MLESRSRHREFDYNRIADLMKSIYTAAIAFQRFPFHRRTKGFVVCPVCREPTILVYDGLNHEGQMSFGRITVVT
jgi:hypothetical protein